MPDFISLLGPVELLDGQLVLQIPLEAGGDKLAEVAGGISRVDDEFLTIVIQPWLAEKLNIRPGGLVHVDNANGKFNITRSAANDDPKSTA